MQRYILGRFIQGIVSVILVATTVFIIVRMTGNPLDVITDPRITEQERQAVAERLGLDQPVIVQYGRYIASLAQGDFGKSFQSQRPALELVIERLPATIQLTTAAMFVALVIALPVGVYAAVRRGSTLDAVVRLLAFSGQSAPPFWTGIMAIWIFAVILGVLPCGGRSGIQSIILPAATMGWFGAAGIIRLTRSSMLDVLGSDYITMARAKGLPEWIVIWKHGFKNAAIPVLTYCVLLFVLLLSGAVVAETVFAWPGVGRLMITSVHNRDFPVVQAVIILVSIFYIGANLIVDILYAWLNPKIRYQ